MARIVLFEDEGFVNFLPLTYTRTVFELRHGRRILLDRAAQRLQQSIHGVWTRDWIARLAQLRCGAPANVGVDGDTVLVNGRWLMDGPLHLAPRACVGVHEDQVAYVVCDADLARRLSPGDLLDPARREVVLKGLPREETGGYFLNYPWDIVCHQAETLVRDWSADDAGYETDLDPRCVVDNPAAVYVGPRCAIHPSAVISAADGPVYIGEQVTIGPFAVIEGPISIGPGCRINPHARLHGGNSIGPVCRLGGEIDGCVFQGYSNKQHEGFLGHAYVGSWVNLGASTINSDLKNTYGRIRVPINGRDVDSGHMFFGAVLGDHVKTGINTSIPTGCVIGLASTVMSSRVLPKFVPSFSWLTDEGPAAADPARLLDVAAKVMGRRNVEMSDEEIELFLDLGARVKSYEVRV